MKKLVLLLMCGVGLAWAQKIAELAQIVGIRENSLVGYGLVIGLNGTGDKNGSKFTMQSMANMLESMNVKVSANDIKSKNVAAVMVTANMPAFARAGDKIDIQVSSIGDAKSINGGTLVLTPLSAVDGNIYALAQGAITLGESSNTLSGTLINGATIEREVAYNIAAQDSATLSLKKSDLQNAVGQFDLLHFRKKFAAIKCMLSEVFQTGRYFDIGQVFAEGERAGSERDDVAGDDRACQPARGEGAAPDLRDCRGNGNGGKRATDPKGVCTDDLQTFVQRHV